MMIREAVITDEDYNLIIAGAGTGKTTTIAAKVKCLVDKQGVDARDILVISYTNKAVEELEERINTKLNVDCIISTFHKLGKDISNEQKSVLDNKKLSEIVDTYFKEEVLNMKKYMSRLYILGDLVNLIHPILRFHKMVERFILSISGFQSR